MTSPVMTRPAPAPAPAPSPRPVRRRTPEPERRRDHLRVVTPPTPARLRRRRTGAVLAVAVVLVFGSLLASAVFHGFLVSGQSHLDDLNRQLDEDRAELAREKLQLADLQSPARVAQAAERLGMERSERQTWLSPGTGADPVVTGDPAAEGELAEPAEGPGTDDGTDDVDGLEAPASAPGGDPP